MTSDQPDRRMSGFRAHAPLSSVRDTLRETVATVEGTATRPVSAADGRVLAEAVDSRRDVPHYRRAAMDGYAVRSTELADASGRSPAVLEVENSTAASDPVAPETELPPETALRVHTGSAVPDDADAVVPVERVEVVDDAVELSDPVAVGDDVAPVGEDVESGQCLYEPGHRLRPSDLGLLRAAGVEEVTVHERPTVGVVPTGEELVQRDPAPGEAVETNGLTVSRLVERWGGRAEYRDVVSDDEAALRVAIQRDLHRDVVVTTGGSSVGERDLVPDVVDDLGELLVHGVAIQPGHPVAIGVVEDTPVLCLPGYPVSCIVTAVQLLRPVLYWLAGAEPPALPSEPATLSRKIDSEPGTRTFARARVERPDGDATDGDASEAEPADRVAEPTRARGAGVLSSVALADGWIEVPEDSEGLPAGERVDVQYWEWSP